MRSFIENIFCHRYNVRCAPDGLSGTEMATEYVPDIIVTDLMMPMRDGLEMCMMLKNDERTSHIPVVMLTARATVKDRIKGLEMGDG